MRYLVDQITLNEILAIIFIHFLIFVYLFEKIVNFDEKNIR